MIKEFLQEKYGEFVTNKLLLSTNEVIWDNHNKGGELEQSEIKKHLKSLEDIDGNPLVPKNFWIKNVKWGFDFSSWIGDISNKEFFLIGAEPHIDKNFQLVYDFGNFKDKSTEESALIHYKREDDIWHYLTNIFVDDESNENRIRFLKKCYITDLCHVVPQCCGQIKSICESLEISTKEWKSFRASVAKRFLLKEIQTVNPKNIILHGNYNSPPISQTRLRKIFCNYVNEKD